MYPITEGVISFLNSFFYNNYLNELSDEHMLMVLGYVGQGKDEHMIDYDERRRKKCTGL